MEEKIKKNIPILFLLLGIGLFIYALFGFQSGYYCGQGEKLSPPTLPMPGLEEGFKCLDPVVYYYYPDEYRIFLAIGAIFIAIGISKRKKYSSEKIHTFY